MALMEEKHITAVRVKQGRDLTGQKFGKWTVLGCGEPTEKNERTWLCRCSCGTERIVREHSLARGGSLSCGCLKKERIRNAVAYDLAGKTFGEFTVLKEAQNQKSCGIWWECQCSCGNKKDVLATLLVNGRRTHCGCKTRRGRPNDISGQRFGRLTAQYPTERRNGKGSVIWHCICDCGKEVDYAYNNLCYSTTQSCGCQKTEHTQAMQDFLTHVAGTSVNQLKSKTIPQNSTTGVRGVYLIRGRYTAKIHFQGKQYHLGAYDTLEEAAVARRKAEQLIFEETLDFYARWEACAKIDPEWAEQNPIEIRVEKTSDGFCVTCFPDLPQI